MKFAKIAFVLLCLAGVLVLNAASGAKPKKDNSAGRGKTLYMTCTPCHGEMGEGNPITKAPAIAGLESWYLKVQLKKFKDGVRGAHPEDVTGLQMRPMSRTLVSDKDVELVSDYIAGLPFKPAKATIKGDADKGKVAFAICATCHGANGEGNKQMNGPSLTKLQDWYIVAQLEKFKQGIRGTHHKDVAGMQMRPMAQNLNAETRKNLAAYIVSLAKPSKKSTVEKKH
jgi:cytochrome c553